MSDKRLGALRQEIDRLNQSILSMIQGRAELVLEIAKIKQAQGLDGYDPQRELEMLQSLTAGVTGPFGPDEVKEIFKSIFRASLDIQDAAGAGVMMRTYIVKDRLYRLLVTAKSDMASKSAATRFLDSLRLAETRQ